MELLQQIGVEVVASVVAALVIAFFGLLFRRGPVKVNAGAEDEVGDGLSSSGAGSISRGGIGTSRVTQLTYYVLVLGASAFYALGSKSYDGGDPSPRVAMLSFLALSMLAAVRWSYVSAVFQNARARMYVYLVFLTFALAMMRFLEGRESLLFHDVMAAFIDYEFFLENWGGLWIFVSGAIAIAISQIAAAIIFRIRY
jgi:hypothetical protein